MEMKQLLIKTMSVLTISAVIGAALVAITYQVTRVQIAHNERETLLRVLNEVMPSDLRDNQLSEDVIEMTHNTLLGSAVPQTIYRARLKGQPSGAVLSTTAPNGYNGQIKLLVGVDLAGQILGVRVLSHQETPGLGDDIELKHSNWITTFVGHSLTQPEEAGWAVKRDGGMFDQFTGATITPRAVVQAVFNTLKFYQQNRDQVFQTAPVAAQ